MALSYKTIIIVACCSFMFVDEISSNILTDVIRVIFNTCRKMCQLSYLFEIFITLCVFKCIVK